MFAEEWDRRRAARGASREVYPVSLTKDAGGRDPRRADARSDRFVEDALAAYEAKEATVGAAMMRELERVVLLNIIDTQWREHLYEMDYLQEGIYLRSYAQKDPITEYRREAFDMFEELTRRSGRSSSATSTGWSWSGRSSSSAARSSRR